MTPRVVVIGSVNLDLAASIQRLPRPGETVTGATLSRFPGGKGANQALAARRLGAEVTLIAGVGDDAEAGQALALLEEGGVDLSRLVVMEDAPTGIALISVAANGENQIVVAPGANALMWPGDAPLPDADALICQLEVPQEVVAEAAGRFEGLFCVNLAPARDVDAVVIERADLIVVNQTEAEWYGERLAACSGLVATTFGRDGAELKRGGQVVARVGAPNVDAIDTVGAGDAFTAALAVAFAEGHEPDSALAFACTAGSLATTKRGAQPSLPTRAEVEALYNTSDRAR